MKESVLDVWVSSAEIRAERDVRDTELDVPSSVCEEVSALVVEGEVLVEDEAEGETDVDTAAEDEAPDKFDDEVEAVFDANAEDEAEAEVEDEAAMGDEVEEGGLPIAAAFVVIRAPPLVTTTPVAALLPELAVQLEVSTLVRLK